MKEVLCFIYDGFADFETVLTCSALNEEINYKVTYIAYEKTPVCSCGGLKINPDKTVSEIEDIKNIEGLIIPGGTRIFKPELEKLIKRLNDSALKRCRLNLTILCSEFIYKNERKSQFDN